MVCVEAAWHTHSKPYKREEFQATRNGSTSKGKNKFKLSVIHLFLLQHSSSEGVPFHSISLTSIVRQCLGNYDVAKNVKRYPVYVEDTFRYLAMH